jgi:hypothetical protein
MLFGEPSLGIGTDLMKKSSFKVSMLEGLEIINSIRLKPDSYLSL